MVELDDDAGLDDDVELSEEGRPLVRGQDVTVAGRHGTITGFARDRDHAYVRFDDGARKIAVEELGT